MSRHILHVDMNAFYASVEQQRRPELRDKAVAVCGSQEERHGIVLTASYPAKRRGVKTGMAIWQAKQHCPDLVVLPPDMGEYMRISRLARNIYERYTDQVEPFGLDEAWLDITGSVDLFGSPMTIAQEISDKVKYNILTYFSNAWFAVLQNMKILEVFHNLADLSRDKGKKDRRTRAAARDRNALLSFQSPF